jgi:NTP pyrophosphatase (non-canonical NTP hydrolase)
MNQKDILDWRKNNFPDPPDAMKQALVLAEETGEVCRAVIKREQGIRGTYEEWSANLKIELAQTLITLFAIAELEGFDLLDYTTEYWDTLKQRNFN